MTQPKIHRLLGLGLGFARRPQLDVVDGGDAVKEEEEEEEELDESLAQTRLGMDRQSGDDLDAAVSLAQTRAATGDVRQTEDRAKETGPVSIAATLIPSDRPTATEEAAAEVSISALMRTMSATGPDAPSTEESEEPLDVSLAQTRIAGDTGDLLENDELEGKPLSLARTLTPIDAARSRRASDDSGSRASLRRDEAITDDPDLARRLLKPKGNDGHLKDLIRARIFRKKAAPVKIGRYTILDQLGEGGMGVVYTAFDDKLERKIAIKVMRSDNTEGSNGRIRLIREAQAMARLAHPNIATVHEVGEVDDQIFVAMEYIRGKSLDQWQEEPHPWREVVEVFCQAGRGLAAAHDAGIIHRDFKPHNVLLGEDGTAKVLDFGLARSMTQGQLTDGQATGEAQESESKALAPTGGKELSLLDQRLTRTGALMGTPAYMAPEQHEGRPANAQSDQFSFCVALYEGLYGELPFEATSLPALIASVLEGKVKDPPSSAKVPKWLRKVLLRGLDVEPERRFVSVSALLTELGRDPVARRRRWLATAAFAGIIGGAGFGAASLNSAQAAVCTSGGEEIGQVWGYEQHTAVKQAIKATGLAYADETWEKIAPQLDTYAREWAEMRGEACESHQSGKHSDRIFDLRTSCLDLRLASLSGLVNIFMEANGEVLDNASQAIGSVPRVSSCADTARLTEALSAPEDPVAAHEVHDARRVLARAQATELAGQYNRANELIQPLEAKVSALAHPPLTVEFNARRGSLAMQLNDPETADKLFTDTLWQAISIGHDLVALEAASKRIFVRSFLMGEAESALADADLAISLARRADAPQTDLSLLYNNLGVAHDVAGNLESSREAYNTAISQASNDSATASHSLGSTLSNKGVLELKFHRFDEAHSNLQEAALLFDKSLGAHHPHQLFTRLNLSFALQGKGSLSDATQEIEALIPLAYRSFGPDSPNTLWFDQGRANLVLELHRYKEAKESLTEIRARAIKVTGESSAIALLSTIDLASSLGAVGESTEALSLHNIVYEQLRSNSTVDPTIHSQALDAYGTTLHAFGDFEKARRMFLEALTLREEKLPPNTPSLAITLEKLAQTYIALERYEDAAAALGRAKKIVADKLPPTSQLNATVERTTAELELARGNPAAAVEHARAALSIHEATRDADDGELALTRFALARALNAQAPASAEAKSLATAAVEILRGGGAGWEPEAERVDTWLKSL